MGLYVAVVSDNDGSAFITKAEFDSLKNNFQAQIDNYNQSIDSKIDGAIASYLAGIKVNADDTPEFRVWGYDCGIFMGKKARNFRIVYALAGSGWPGASAKTTGGFLVMPSGGTKTNRGYGYAYFFTDLYKSFKRLTFPQGSWGPVGYEGAGQGERAPGQSGMASQLPVQIRTSASDTTSSDFWADNPSHLKSDNLYYYEKTLAVISYAYLSDIFQTVINCDRPEFPIYEFLDAGDITLDIGYIDNGYEYEGGAYGGAGGGFAPTSFKIIHKKSTGDTVLAADYSSATTTSYKQYNVSVKPGDRIVISCGGGGSGTNGKYCLIHYGAQIAGWRAATV